MQCKVGEFLFHGSRSVKVMDLKWNLVRIQYRDGDFSEDWVDCRELTREPKTT